MFPLWIRGATRIALPGFCLPFCLAFAGAREIEEEEIYFERVVTASHKAGVIGVTLVKQFPLAEGGILKIEQGVAGYIHGSIPATKELIAHLQAVVEDAERDAALAAAPTGLRN